MNNLSKCNPEDFGITFYTVNSDKSIDITQDVKMDNCELTEIPFKINQVSGKLDLSNNKLTSIKNAPKFCVELTISYNPIKFLDKENMEVSVAFAANETKLSSLDNLPKCSRIHTMSCEIEDTSFLNKIKEFQFAFIMLNKNKISSFLHPELKWDKVLSLDFNPLQLLDVSEKNGLIRIQDNSLSYEHLKVLKEKKYKVESLDKMIEDELGNYKRKYLVDNL